MSSLLSNLSTLLGLNEPERCSETNNEFGYSIQEAEDEFLVVDKKQLTDQTKDDENIMNIYEKAISCSDSYEDFEYRKSRFEVLLRKKKTIATKIKYLMNSSDDIKVTSINSLISCIQKTRAVYTVKMCYVYAKILIDSLKSPVSKYELMCALRREFIIKKYLLTSDT